MQNRFMKADVQPLADKQMCIHTRRHAGWHTSRPVGTEEDKHVWRQLACVEVATEAH
jgi:hypothetical protein